MERAELAHGTRSLLVRVLAAALVALAAIGVRELWLDEEQGRSDARGARVVEASVQSELIGEELPVEVVVPKTARKGKRAMVVFLHSRGSDEETYLTEPVFDALARQGNRAPLIAFPRGGPDSYWHDRDSGAWGSYVLEEAIPRLVERFEIEPEQLAIGGISMGGFGAFNLARRRPELFCAVAAHSPAVWHDGEQTAPGAFDDAADFDRNDVIAALEVAPGLLEGLRAWVDVGDEDPFAEASEQLAEAARSAGARTRLRIGEGGHDGAYWNGNWPAYMRFYADALDACQRRG